MWRGSSYGNEDLPSDYLGFYAAARYPALANRPDLALKFIIGELGGGGEQVGEPAHAGLLRSASLSFPWYPIYWGILV